MLYIYIISVEAGAARFSTTGIEFAHLSIGGESFVRCVVVIAHHFFAGDDRVAEPRPSARFTRWFLVVLVNCFIAFVVCGSVCVLDVQIGVVGVSTVAAEAAASLAVVPTDFLAILHFGLDVDIDLQISFS